MHSNTSPQRRSFAGLFCLVWLLFAVSAPEASVAQCNCEPLPVPEPGTATYTIGTLTELEEALNSATGRTTIFLESGTYRVTSNRLVNIGKAGITLRSLSGNRDDVIIEGEGMDAQGLGHGIYINAVNVTIANLTVKEVQNHGIFVNPGADNCRIYNVRVLDCGEQLFKASGYPELPPKNNGIIECSTFEYTTTLDDGDDGWYTNGIDLLNSHNWIIRDNVIRNIKHNPAITNQLAGPAILVWGGSSGTVVERNRVIDCDFGISFGNAGQNIVSHSGGVIRNNFVVGYAESDFGIGLIRAPGAIVVHNTVYSPGAWPYSIEARFTESDAGYISNNFTDEPIWADRDGAAYNTMTNLYNASPSDFVDVGSGDLHLASQSIPAIDAGSSAPDRTTDIDCKPVSGSPDIGADEYNGTTAIAPLQPVGPEVHVYPNPALGRISIHSVEPCTLRLFTSLGETVVERLVPATQHAIDLATKTRGVYFLEVTTANSTSTRVISLR